MKYTFFDTKNNILYINSNQLLPCTKGMSFKEYHKAYDKAFTMSYKERINQFACNEAKEEIKKELKAHKDCKISEYLNI